MDQDVTGIVECHFVGLTFTQLGIVFVSKNQKRTSLGIFMEWKFAALEVSHHQQHKTSEKLGKKWSKWPC